MNKKLGIILALIGFFSSITAYHNIMAVPILAATMVFGSLISVLSMCQIYHHQNYNGLNYSGRFWMTYSRIGAVLLFSTIICEQIGLINSLLSLSIGIGLLPTILPLFGCLIGDFGRITLKNKQSVL